MKLYEREHGQAIVEMALVIPLFFLLFFAVIEMGRVGFAYVSVSNAARTGVRVASTGGTDLDIQNNVLTAAPSLNTSELTLQITPTEGNRQSGQSVDVSITYPVHLILPVISDVLPNPFIVSSHLSMRME
ncbi:TadE/TadG family type IV pilus assembly protein [Desulfitobacterium sp. Sab5]|uniref:TadE/TadG family type IV pilus assembly protein n=1 Tax=Desulfitobacterium TaxID=36853 RepID=UPI003CF6FE29